MPRPPKAKSAPKDSSANLGFGVGGCKSAGANGALRSNPTTRRLAILNLALRSIKAGFGPPAMAGPDNFRRGFDPDLGADCVLANGPASAGSSNQSGDCHARSAIIKPKAKPQSLPRLRDIRQKLIEADLVDCMVAFPGQLFYSTQIPVCLWFLTRSKAADAKRGFRDRRKQMLFIDARKLDRPCRDLTYDGTERSDAATQVWPGENGGAKYICDFRCDISLNAA